MGGEGVSSRKNRIRKDRECEEEVRERPGSQTSDG